MIDVPSKIIAVRAISCENDNYYLHAFLDECFFEL